MSSFDRHGALDLSTPRIVVCIGKKRSGKSVMGRYLFDSYPWDRLVIDANGDDGPYPSDDPDIHDIHGTVDTLPRDWKEVEDLRRDDRRLTLRYVPDAGSPTWIEDMDAAIGLARSRDRCGVLVHEMGKLAQSNRTPANTRRILQSNRHRQPGGGGRTTLIACAPRKLNMDPLVLMQADVVYVFDLPNKADRQEVAGEIGWPTEDFIDGVAGLPPHAYLRYDANQAKPERPEDPDLRLLQFPPLPEDIVRSVT